jgi:hypothetical protein
MKKEENIMQKLPRCEYCNKPFVPNHKKQKYCCDAHRQAAFQEKKKKAGN